MYVCLQAVPCPVQTLHILCWFWPVLKAVGRESWHTDCVRSSANTLPMGQSQTFCTHNTSHVEWVLVSVSVDWTENAYCVIVECWNNVSALTVFCYLRCNTSYVNGDSKTVAQLQMRNKIHSPCSLPKCILNFSRSSYAASAVWVIQVKLVSLSDWLSHVELLPVFLSRLQPTGCIPLLWLSKETL